MQPGARGLAEHRLQRGKRGVGDVGDRAEAAAEERLLGRLPHSPERADRQSVQERQGLGGGDDEQAVGLAARARELGDELGGGRPDRAGETGLGVHAAADHGADLGGRAEEPAGSRHVEERLVDAERLHERRDVAEDAHDHARPVRVLLHVSADDGGLRAEAQRLGHGHGRADAEAPGLVGGAGDHAAAR